MIFCVAKKWLRPSEALEVSKMFFKEVVMVINVHAHGFTLSKALRQHVEECLAAATRPFARAVSSVTARLTDVNAGRGGHDKQCRLVAVLPHRRLIVTEGLHADAYASIEQSSNRMRRAISHALGRDTRRGRRPRRGSATEAAGPLMSIVST
jgi:ribosome-associated translation inhibitor RaiA